MATRSSTSSLLLTLALLVGSAACADGGGAEALSPEDSLRAAKVGMSEAMATAAAELPEGVLVEGEFEIEGETPIYEVEFLVGEDDVREVFIDPEDGRVLKVSPDPEDLEEARAAVEILSKAGLTLAEAVAVAERETGGRVFEAEPGERGFVFAVLTDAGPVELILAPADGAVLSREARDEGPEVEDADHHDDDDEDDDDD